MSSPFKMNPKTPLMKALVGKQGNLPQHLQDAIKAAPESPAKSYGKSPMKKTEKTDAELKAQRGFTTGAGKGKRKVKTKTPTSIYVKKEKTASAIAPRGIEGKSPAKMTGGKAKSKTKRVDSFGPKAKIEKGKNTIPKMKQTKSDLRKNYRTGDKSPAKMTGGKKGIGKAPNAKMQARVKSVGKQGRPTNAPKAAMKATLTNKRYKKQ